MKHKALVCTVPAQAVLNLYPYYIDSLLQLSEVSKMTEDYQMAADLIGMAYIVCLDRPHQLTCEVS